jgi:Spy/CpxP family protein refolding chaperone
MTKLIALVAAGLFVAGTMFAGQHGDCTKQAGYKGGKMACTVSLANLNLTPDQKTKMDALMKQHEKEGCTEVSEAKYMREAHTILGDEKYAKFEAECKKSDKDKPETSS